MPLKCEICGKTHTAKYKYCDVWELNTALIEIHWKGGVAVEVAVGGRIFKATKAKRK